jgi:hypothetical protein
MGERFAVGSNVQTVGEHLSDLLFLLRDKARALRELRLGSLNRGLLRPARTDLPETFREVEAGRAHARHRLNRPNSRAWGRPTIIKRTSTTDSAVMTM